MRPVNYSVEVITSDDDFEKFCHRLYSDMPEYKDIQFNGRSGYEQHGVDIFGYLKETGELIGIQCKYKDHNLRTKLTEAELRAEVDAAKGFQPKPPDAYHVLTTSPGDPNLQRIALEITEAHKAQGLFPVIVKGWQEIQQQIPFSQKVIAEFYPHLQSDSGEILKEIRDGVLSISEKLSGSLQPENPVSDEEIAASFKQSSERLRHWPQSLSVNNKWIERSEENQLLAKISSSYFSTTVLLGEPGSGKSALLARMTERLLAEGKTVIGIKADMLDPDICNVQDLDSRLGLPAPLASCVGMMAKKGPVYILIDQLDALSELVDVKTQRLSVLLDLVYSLAKRPNVHIILSSRPFEFEHDARLSTIDAEQIKLALPPWETVEAVFKELNIVLTHIDDGFKNILRRPSNLNLYLKYLKAGGAQKIYHSHIHLYDDVWNRDLGGAEDKKRRTDLMVSMAVRMTEEARLWLPCLQYEDHQEDIDWLVEAGFLVKNESGCRFSFSHQTIQAYAWTRAFIKGRQSLSDFVLATQDNLNCRPKLSTALIYLRDADPEEYDRQITVLLGRHLNNIRKHVLHLLIEHIGAQESPDETEIQLIHGLLEDKNLLSKICISVAGQAGWFDALKITHLPAWMQGDKDERWYASIILRDTAEKRRTDVLSLINLYWRNKDGLEGIWSVLRDFEDWDNDSIDLALFLVGQEGVGDHVASEIAEHVALSAPDKAPAIILKFFESKLSHAIAHPLPPLSPLPPEATVADHMARIKDDPKKPFEKLLDLGTDWHELKLIAAASPQAFIETLWDWFIKALELIKEADWHTCATEYKHTSGIWFHLSDEPDRAGHSYLPEALEKGITLFARQNPAGFLAFILRAEKTDLMPAHRLLAKGFEALAPTNARAGLHYLLGDPRRLTLRGLVNDSEYSGTTSLIAAITPYLDESDVRKLEEAIQALPIYVATDEHDVERRRSVLRYNREGRTILLESIHADKTTKEIKKLIEEDERSFQGSGFRRRSTFRSGWVVHDISMTPEQMMKAGDTDILNCLKKFPDSRPDSWREDGRLISSSDISNSFGTLAEKDPQRALRLLDQIGPENKRAVMLALQGLAKSDLPLPELLNTIENLVNKGFGEQEFHQYAARAIEQKIAYPVGLDDQWIQRLESWLIEPSLEIAEDQDQYTGICYSRKKEQNQPDRKKPECILWSSGAMSVCPNGNFPVLDAITDGALRKETPSEALWFDIMHRHLHRNEHIEVWRALILRFRGILDRSDKVATTKFVDALLKKYPVLTEGIYGGTLLAYARAWADNDDHRRWMEMLLAQGTESTNLLFGELLGLRYVLNHDDEWALGRVETVLQSAALPLNQDILCGLAYSAIHLWNDEKYKEKATTLIAKVADIDYSPLAYILIDLFRISDDLSPGCYTDVVLDTFIQHKILEKSSDRSYAARTLKSLTRLEPERVLTLARHIVNASGKDLGNISTAAAADSPDLVTIAITLHDMGPDYQAQGLDLFEELLDLNAYKAKDVLVSIDSHPRVQKSKPVRKLKTGTDAD